MDVVLLNSILGTMDASYDPQTDTIICHKCGNANECCTCQDEEEEDADDLYSR